MNGLLEGKVAIVTRGAGALGGAICELFAAHGASLVVNDFSSTAVLNMVEKIRAVGGRAVPHVADAGTVQGANGCVTAVLDAYGKFDVLVVNAGLFPESGRIHSLPLTQIEQVLHDNIGGVYLPVRAAIPALQKTRGAIVVTGSENALHGMPRSMTDAPMEDWVGVFVRGVAAEQGAHGVRANVVAPGPVETGTTEAMTGSALPTLSIDQVPLGRRGTPREVANIFLFLASDLASYVTGAVYAVDGGAAATVARTSVNEADS